MNLGELRKAAEAIAYAAIKAADPEALIYKSVKLENNRLQVGENSVELSDFRRIIVVGAGKASASMADALETILGERISDGAVVVKDGHTKSLQRIKVLEAGHPVPDQRGVEAAHLIVSLLENNASRDTLVLCVISGGGSALMPLPHDNITLEAKQDTTRLLLGCGASIDEINVIRKHISKTKGGQLARTAAPARLICLLLSDVIGDSLDVIASGPTVGDSSTFSDAREIMNKYNIWGQIPPSVQGLILKGVSGEIAETPKRDDPIFESVSNVIIGNNRGAIEAASEKAASMGFNPFVFSTCIKGEARAVGTEFAAMAIESRSSHKPISPPACILAGGETTVTIRGHGKGGRNQELALAAALRLESASGIVIAGIGTDGTDGPTDAAGAIVDTTTAARARSQGLEPLRYLEQNDSYNLLKPIDDLFITGPTGTNVMDLIIALTS